MEYKTFSKDNILIIHLVGKFNIEKVEEFEDKFINTPENDILSDIIAIDMKDLSYIDSSALGSIIKFMNITKGNNGEFFIYNLSSNIFTILQMAYLDKFFYISTSEKLNSKFNTDIF